MRPETGFELLSRHQSEQHAALAARLTRDSLSSLRVETDPTLHEKLTDLLRAEHVAEAFQAARSGSGVSGEPARMDLRARIPAYLHRVTAEARRERVARLARLDVPPGGFETSLARAELAAERRSLFRAWREHEDALATTREALAQGEQDAAGRVGASSAEELMAAGQPCDPGRLEGAFLRGAVEPLDDAIEAAGRERWNRCRSVRVGVGAAEDVPALVSMRDHHEMLPWSRIVPVLREIAGGLGADPDVGGPRLVADAATGPWSLTLRPGDRPVMLAGQLDGPAALVRALEAWGRAVRASFLDRVDPLRSRWCDPAFSHAIGVVFRRLPLQPGFRASCGLADRQGLPDDLRFEDAVAPRLAWVYLSLVRRTGDGIEAAWRRAAARPAMPCDLSHGTGAGAAGAAAIRGTVLGLLLEERWMTRFGREWYLERGARRELREFWEAEPGQTAESVASALGAGTIDAAPILDRCRP